MKTLFASLMIGSLLVPLTAQKTIDILSLSGRYGFTKPYEDTYTGEATEWGSINSLTAGAKLSEKTMLAINLNHFYFNVKGGQEIPENVTDPININGLILRTGIIQQLGNGRSIQLLVAPRLMSDFKNLDGNSFQIGGVATYEKVFNDGLTMSFGAMYNQELFGPYLVPLVNLDWQISGKWSIAGMLPVTARVIYRVNDNMIAGFNHFGLITSYYLGEEAYAGDYMERQSIDLSLFLRQRLYRVFFVEGMVGRTFGRSYKQFEGNQKVDFALPLITFGDNRTVKNATFNDGLILTLKLVINIPKPV